MSSTISYHCSICGDEVTDCCPTHPNAMIHSVMASAPAKGTPAAFGVECAQQAIEVGGPFPFDAAGECLLPTMPLSADKHALREAFPDGLDDDAFESFMDAYRATMAAHTRALYVQHEARIAELRERA